MTLVKHLLIYTRTCACTPVIDNLLCGFPIFSSWPNIRHLNGSVRLIEVCLSANFHVRTVNLSREVIPDTSFLIYKSELHSRQLSSHPQNKTEEEERQGEIALIRHGDDRTSKNWSRAINASGAMWIWEWYGSLDYYCYLSPCRFRFRTGEHTGDFKLDVSCALLSEPIKCCGRAS